MVSDVVILRILEWGCVSCVLLFYFVVVVATSLFLREKESSYVWVRDRGGGRARGPERSCGRGNCDQNIITRKNCSKNKVYNHILTFCIHWCFVFFFSRLSACNS